jgi:hypothetical protein
LISQPGNSRYISPLPAFPFLHQEQVSRVKPGIQIAALPAAIRRYEALGLGRQAGVIYGLRPWHFLAFRVPAHPVKIHQGR